MAAIPFDRFIDPSMPEAHSTLMVNWTDAGPS